MIQGTVLFFLKYPFFVFVKNATAYETTIPYFRRKVKKYPHCLFGNTFFPLRARRFTDRRAPLRRRRKIPHGENVFCLLQSGKAIRQRSLNAKKQDKRGRKKDGSHFGCRPFYLAQEEGFEPPCLLGKRFSNSFSLRTFTEFPRRFRTGNDAENPSKIRTFRTFEGSNRIFLYFTRSFEF